MRSRSNDLMVVSGHSEAAVMADIVCEQGQGEAYVEPGHEAMTLGDDAQLSRSP